MESLNDSQKFPPLSKNQHDSCVLQRLCQDNVIKFERMNKEYQMQLAISHFFLFNPLYLRFHCLMYQDSFVFLYCMSVLFNISITVNVMSDIECSWKEDCIKKILLTYLPYISAIYLCSENGNHHVQ